MTEHIEVLTHSSIRIRSGNCTIYVDPAGGGNPHALREHCRKKIGRGCICGGCEGTGKG